MVLVLVLVLSPLAVLALDSTVLPTNKEATRIDGGTWPRQARLWEDRLEKERKKEKYEGRQRLVSCKRALIHSNRLSRVLQGRPHSSRPLGLSDEARDEEFQGQGPVSFRSNQPIEAADVTSCRPIPGFGEPL